MKETYKDPFDNAPIMYVRSCPELPTVFISDEARQRMRNEKKHRLTCDKRRKKRKKKRKCQ